ncbi:O-antigen ligase family protein [Hufsiella ginkgonis]|uniref:O-antigen ligase domain-containing protein n=1 Tax=Hufsiella ginkgonis TaxID=2695274 RepID=A0A7K1XZE5_9SPHI|nr:O-antigen ligase family protein [Hufsiella ginkgonis]MXV16178.1 O-antigen ligase domain-containing protein [Hufsiella ginkgonis]
MPVVYSSERRYKPETKTFVERQKIFLRSDGAKRLGLGLMCLTSLLISFLISIGGIKAGVMIMVVLVALPMLYITVVYPRTGILILLIAAYMVMWVIRMNLISFPLGTVMDGLEALLLLGFFIKQKTRRDWQFMKNPISVLIIIWISYNLLQALNPGAASVMAWLYTVRSVAVVMVMYFIFSYHIRTVQFIRLIFKIWLGLCTYAALYALKQEFIGFNSYELAYINTPGMDALLFIGGFWRKFSIFSDPVAFSYNMVAGAVLALGLMFGNLPVIKKVILGFLIALFLFAMIYSGTRGAYLLFPAAIGLVAILHFNQRVMFLAGVVGMFMLFLINVPTSNAALYRFQSTFKISEDASYNVRAINQKRIQPYIQTHIIGGGLGATGIWGTKFAPDSYLAKLPPDSGYVRVAVELGWLGLLIFCTLIFVVLKTGVDNFFKIKDPELRSYCLAMTLTIFALNIGNFPQEAFVQFPTSIYLYLEIALINITLRLDQERGQKRLLT